MAAYKGLDGTSYDSYNAKQAADGRFMERQSRDQIFAAEEQARKQNKEQKRLADQQMAQQRELAAQQIAEQERIAERQMAEQRKIAAQQIAEQQRIVEQQENIESTRQAHVEKMRILGLFDTAGINYSIYENYSKYLFVYESPRHYPPELVALENEYRNIDARYCEASKISFALKEFYATIQAIQSLPLQKRIPTEQLTNHYDDSLINEANRFMVKKPIPNPKMWIILYVAAFLVLSLFFTLLTPLILTLAAVVAILLLRRNKKAKLLAHLYIRANPMHQQINELAGVNTTDIDYAIRSLSEQSRTASEKTDAFVRELVKHRWNEFYLFRLNNYNPIIEKLLLDMDIPAQIQEYDIEYVSISKNIAKGSTDDIQDYIVYFQEATK